MNAAARLLGVEAAPHSLDDVVDRPGEAAPQLDDQAFFPLARRGGQPMWAGGTIGDILAALPPATWAMIPSSRAIAVLEERLCRI